MAKKLTKAKAREILHDKEVHGHPLTDKQRRFFGAVSSGYIKAQNGIEGTMGGLTDKGFNFNPAWGGAWKNGGWLDKYADGGNLQPPMAGANQITPMYAMGGSLPGSVGFTYARVAGAAPSEGPRAKKTMPSAQKGKNVDANQEFLKDWYSKRKITDPYIQGALELDRPAYMKNLQTMPEYTMVKSIDNDPNITGRYEADKNRLLLTRNAPEHVKTHELNHYLNNLGAGEYMRSIHKDIVGNELLPQSQMQGVYKDKYDYFSNPDEVHSRIMVLRQKAGFKPDETVTPEKLKGFMKTYKGDVDNINDLLNMSKGEEGLLNMLNFMAKGKSSTPTTAQNGAKVPVIEDEGSFNKDGVWIPDWEKMTAQAKKLGAKKVRTKHGSVIYFNDKWEVSSVDDNPDAKAQNGMEMKYYQEGLDWKPKTISKNGGWLDKYETPEAQRGILQQRYSVGPMMGDLAVPSQAEVARQAQIRKEAAAREQQLAARARYEAMPKVGPAKQRSYSEQVQAEEQRRMLNEAYAAQNPEVTVDESGDIVPSGYGRFMQTYGPSIEKFARSLETPLAIQGVGELAYGLGKVGAKYLPQVGEYLTTQTPLRNTYRLNPWAFKPNPEAYYRGVGKEGIEDIFESGVIRSKKQNAYPEPYFSKGVIGDKYAKGYFAELTNEPMKGVGSFSTGDLIQTPANTVGINNPNLKLYQKDWLRGYKEVPKPTKKKGGEVIKDNDGYWNPSNHGKVVEINSNYITMRGVDQPLIGVSDTGDVQYMEPGNDYEFDGTKVREYPVAQRGRQVSSRASGPLLPSMSRPTSADTVALYNQSLRDVAGFMGPNLTPRETYNYIASDQSSITGETRRKYPNFLRWATRNGIQPIALRNMVSVSEDKPETYKNALVLYPKPKPKPSVKKETPKTETKKAPVKSVTQTTDQLGMFRNPNVELLIDQFGNYEWFRKDDPGDMVPVRRATREEIEYSKKQKQRNGGVSVNKADEYPLEKLDNLLNFTNYNKPTAKNGKWLDKYK